jgi:hypothetical protein
LSASSQAGSGSPLLAIVVVQFGVRVKSGFYQDRISTGREGGTSDDRIALSRVMSGDGAKVRTLRNVMKA